MASFQTFEEIHAWQSARSLARDVYQLTSKGPFRRDFPLRDQIRRASISVMSNIAEGFERRRPAEFAHFLSIAKGSAAEIKAQLYLALDIAYVSQAEFDELFDRADVTSKLIHGLNTYIQTRRSGDDA